MHKRFITTLALLTAGFLNANAEDRLELDDLATEIEGLGSIANAAQQRQAIYESARQWAEVDPGTAYAAIMDLPPGSLRDDIEGSLVTSWLAVDTATALHFFASLDEPPAYLVAASTIRGTMSGWLPVSPDSDLSEILDISTELPVQIARSLRLQIIRRLARSDPQTAAERILTFPPEERRQAGLNISRDYASANPDAALAWARELQHNDIEQAVVQAMVAEDPYGMLARAVSGEDGITLPLVAQGAFGSRGLDRSQFGSSLLQLPRTAASERALASFTQSWLVLDQDGALDWLANSGEELPREAIMRAASRAGRDPDFAARFAERLQGENRSEWIENVASQTGQLDAVIALDWLEPFRTDPAYTRAVAKIIPQLAVVDGPRAARLIQVLDGRQWLGATWTVSRQWAKTDPVAAAQWADGLPENARGPSIRAAVDEWHSYDSAGAERWALGLPRAALREEALRALVAAVANDGQIPPQRMFDAFGTESARQNSILGAIGMLTMQNRKAARELYETQLTDPVLRERAKVMLNPPPPEPGQRLGLFGPVPAPRDTN